MGNTGKCSVCGYDNVPLGIDDRCDVCAVKGEEGETKKELICPKCKAEISYLRFSYIKSFYGSISIDEKGFENWDDESEMQGLENLQITCPDCAELLFKDENEAFEFLKGEKKK